MPLLAPAISWDPKTDNRGVTHTSVVLRSTLHDGTDNHDDETNGDGKTTAPVVGDEGDKGNRSDGTNLVKSDKETEITALRIVEELLPRVKVLDRVEEHAIEQAQSVIELPDLCASFSVSVLFFFTYPS